MPVWANNPVLIQDDRPMLIIGIDALEYRNWDLGLTCEVGILGEYRGDSHGTRIRPRVI